MYTRLQCKKYFLRHTFLGVTGRYESGLDGDLIEAAVAEGAEVAETPVPDCPPALALLFLPRRVLLPEEDFPAGVEAVAAAAVAFLLSLLPLLVDGGEDSGG